MTIANMSVFLTTIIIDIHQKKYDLMKSIMYGGVGIFASMPWLHLLYNEFFN